MDEIWKDVIGFENKYEVSNLGNVRNYNTKRKLSTRKTNGNGYIVCRLLGKNQYFHRLVAKAFLNNPDNLPEVNHINGVKSDNRVENLEWCDSKQNQIHASKIGVLPKGEDHPNSKLTESQVLDIRNSYSKGLVTQCELAEKYNIHQLSVWEIIHRRTWKHI